MVSEGTIQQHDISFFPLNIEKDLLLSMFKIILFMKKLSNPYFSN